MTDYDMTCKAVDTDDWHNWGESPCSLTKGHKGDHKTWVVFMHDEDGVLKPIRDKPDHAWSNRDDFLREIDAIHIEWGETKLDDINQLELWERIGRVLRKAGI